MAVAQHIQATFIKGATAPEHFPAHSMPEVAMIGRSNVGKSSLINAITRNSSLARVSNTPGKTQEINFFETDLGMVLVDLPGYGYARVSKEQRSQFSKLIHTYIETREPLALICVLVDARHDPQPLDMAMLEELEFAQKKFVVLLTKCDKLSEKQVQSRIDQMNELLSSCANVVDVVATSAKVGLGRPSIIGIMKKARKAFSTEEEE
ncbi:MAG: YihA family ribosome biogenesis GTP-binding protein [Ignavibacteria bacterium]|nr:YihA family ribosome biogenesis GTP-binding protein [Ignavibacteria bacterium]